MWRGAVKGNRGRARATPQRVVGGSGMTLRTWHRVWKKSPTMVRAAMVGAGYYMVERRVHRH
jgi:hypothetical protein